MYASSQPRQTFAGGWIQFPAFQIHSPTPVRVKLSLKGSNHIAETHWTTQKTKKFKNLSFKMKLFSLNGRVCGNVALLFWQRKPSLFFLGSFFSIWGLEQFIGASQWRHTDTLDRSTMTYSSGGKANGLYQPSSANKKQSMQQIQADHELFLQAFESESLLHIYLFRPDFVAVFQLVKFSKCQIRLHVCHI